MINLKIFSLITVPLGLSIFIYGLFISLAEERFYGKFSIDYFFLTPTDLAQMAKSCKDLPEFIYSSADGPKPVITSLTCDLDKAKTLHFLIDNGFSNEHGNTDKLGGLYKKKDIDVEISKSKESNLYKVMFFEYL